MDGADDDGWSKAAVEWAAPSVPSPRVPIPLRECCSFDVVTAVNSLQFADRMHAALAETVRVTVRGGRYGRTVRTTAAGKFAGVLWPAHPATYAG